jgi:hypothetical protein
MKYYYRTATSVWQECDSEEAAVAKAIELMKMRSTNKVTCKPIDIIVSDTEPSVALLYAEINMKETREMITVSPVFNRVKGKMILTEVEIVHMVCTRRLERI